MNRFEQIAARLGAQFAAFLLRLPRRVIRLIAGPAPPVAAGLDPEALLIARLSSLPRPGENNPLAGDARGRMQMEIEAGVFGANRAPYVSSAERTIPGPAGEIPVRLYTPQAAPSPAPLIVFYHGGGWVTGSLNTHDSVCRVIAEVASIQVLSVDYRLAPEHPFPAAAHDAIAVFEYVVGNPSEFDADPAWIAVGGDSAGGNLAAVVALATRGGESPPPSFQLLIYPAVSFSRTQLSHRDFAQGFLLTSDKIDRYIDAYTPDARDQSNPLAAPLLWDDLHGVAPAYIATALADPLRDEGEEYAERLRAAGVSVELQRFPLLHGFVNMGASPAAAEATVKIASAVRDAVKSTHGETTRRE